ncbi:MAG TPA: DUF6491 family protein [Caulobacteraceae bacterium]|nr:DUF6491 family protein [Caulobacteraceae bacterium]
MSKHITNTVVRFAASAAIAAGVVLSATAASAQPAANNGNQCFWKRNINGFQAPNDRTVYIRVGVRDIYRLDLMNDCTGLTFRQGIGLETIPPGDGQICNALQATVVYNDTGIRNRCPVTAIHKLTPAEIAALPKRDLP